MMLICALFSDDGFDEDLEAITITPTLSLDEIKKQVCACHHRPPFRSSMVSADAAILRRRADMKSGRRVPHRSKRGTWANYALVPGSLDAVAGVLTTV